MIQTKKFYLFLFLTSIYGLSSNAFSADTWYEKELALDYRLRWNIDGKRKVWAPKDPYVWAYSKRFADNYGMPQEWISPNLRDIDAIAVRVNDIDINNCAMNTENQNNCSIYKQCELDFYIHKSIDLPWLITNQQQGVMIKIKPYSLANLLTLTTKSKNEIFNSENIQSLLIGIPSIRFRQLQSQKESYEPAGVIAQFDKQRLKNYNIIKLVGCDALLSKPSSGNIEFQFAELIPTDKNENKEVQATQNSVKAYIVTIDSFAWKQVSSLAYQNIAKGNKLHQQTILTYQHYLAELNSSPSALLANETPQLENSSYIWAYSKSFSERFGMPAKWVDKELEGVEATAFRRFDGKKDLCQLDLYIDKNVELPWINNEQLQGFHALPYLSQYFLRPQILEELPNYNPRYKTLNGGTPRNSIYAISHQYRNSNGTSSGSIIYHDKISLPNFNIISIKGCYYWPREKYLKSDEKFKLNFLPIPFDMHDPFRPIEGQILWQEDIRHQIHLSHTFLKKINNAKH